MVAARPMTTSLAPRGGGQQTRCRWCRGRLPAKHDIVGTWGGRHQAKHDIVGAAGGRHQAKHDIVGATGGRYQANRDIVGAARANNDVVGTDLCRHRSRRMMSWGVGAEGLFLILDIIIVIIIMMSWGGALPQCRSCRRHRAWGRCWVGSFGPRPHQADAPGGPWG